MQISPRKVWKIFKDEHIEKQYVFYETYDKVFFQKISKNESPISGSFDTDRFFEILPELHKRDLHVVHNHPDDNSLPSSSDYFQQEYLSSLFRLCGCHLKDYAIVSNRGYTSFRKSHVLTDEDVDYPKTSDVQALDLSYPSDICSLKREEKRIISALENVQEILMTPEGSYGASVFSGKDLCDLTEPYNGKCFFICRQDDESPQQQRIEDICNVIDCVEVFSFSSGSLKPFPSRGGLVSA